MSDPVSSLEQFARDWWAVNGERVMREELEALDRMVKLITTPVDPNARVRVPIVVGNTKRAP